MENNGKLNNKKHVYKVRKETTREIKSETHTSSSYIETTHDVFKWLQN